MRLVAGQSAPRHEGIPALARYLARLISTATLLGMAFGGWISGAIFDLTGLYHSAFANGLLWDLLNGSIVLWLLQRRRRLL
jgi:hypothetical protein